MTTKEILLKDLHYLEVLLQEYVSKKSQPDSYEKVASDLVGAGFSIKKDMSFEKMITVNGIEYMVIVVTLANGIADIYERHALIQHKRVYGAPFRKKVDGYEHVLDAIRDRVLEVMDIIKHELNIPKKDE
jgi:hypothetical protein